MRLAYVTDQVYLHGGAERILIQKLNYWAHQGCEVLLITIGQHGNPPFVAIDRRVKHVDLGIDYVEGVSYYHPKNLKNIRTHFIALKKAIAGFQPEAVFVISLGFSRYLVPFAARKTRTYFEYHASYARTNPGTGSFAAKIKRGLSRSFIRFSESFYTKVVFLNQEEADHYKRSNGVVIPNFFEPMASPELPKKKQVITLGRLCHVKGYDLLIDAWAIVAPQAPGWTLEIFGNGEDREALAKQIAERKLEDSVHLNPATDKVGERLSESELYVMSSRVETFPMALLEALSAGIPVVTFDCPSGPRAILTENQDSLFAPRENLGELAAQMLKLINDETLRNAMGQKARQNVKRFSKDAVMQQWHALIQTGRP